MHPKPTLLAAILFLACGSNMAAAESASGWAKEEGAKVRLVAGEPGPDGALRAGLEIRLEQGWKTYWINPGPSGVPPHFDFSGSENLAKAEPLWPAPERFDDGGTSAVGYSGRVIVPIRIAAEDATKPVVLRARLDFGICENICVPARADLDLELGPDTEPDAFSAIGIRGFEARVPVKAKLGGDGPLAITALARTARGLGVSVRFPEGTETADLFASSPDAAVPVPERTAPGTWLIDLSSDAPKMIDLVAVADGAAIRVPVALDVAAPTP